MNAQFNEHGKPLWSIETVQPIYQTPKDLTHTFFFQGRWGRQDLDNTFNLGLGYRYLLEDKTWLLGVNSFYDRTTRYDHQRFGMGAEAIGQYVTVRSNYYNAFSGWKTVSVVNGVTTSEKALDGFDYELELPVPYLPWMRVSATGFHWKSATDGRKDMRGHQFTLRGNISNNVAIELGHRNDNRSPSNNFVKLSLTLGGKPGNGVGDNLFRNAFSSSAFQPRDLTQHTLDKVRRQNEMIVERKTDGAASSGFVVGRGN